MLKRILIKAIYKKPGPIAAHMVERDRLRADPKRAERRRIVPGIAFGHWTIGKAVGMLLALSGAGGSANAFDNEPTGFRGVSWGTKISDIPKLYQIHSITLHQTLTGAAALFGMPKHIRPESLQVNGMTAFIKTDEPLEVAQAPMQSLRYIFSDGELVAVLAAYVDQAPPPNLLTPRGPAVNAKEKVTAALKERFGAPTDPKTLASALFDKKDRTTYMGPTAVVANECDKRTRQCILGFASAPGWIQLTERLSQTTSNDGAPGQGKATGF
jgi:hypothetical protein